MGHPRKCQLGSRVQGPAAQRPAGVMKREMDAGRGMGCMKTWWRARPSSEALPSSDLLHRAEKLMRRLDKQIIGKSVLSTSR